MAEGSTGKLILPSKRPHKPTERGLDPDNPLNRSPLKKKVQQAYTELEAEEYQPIKDSEEEVQDHTTAAEIGSSPPLHERVRHRHPSDQGLINISSQEEPSSEYQSAGELDNEEGAAGEEELPLDTQLDAQLDSQFDQTGHELPASGQKRLLKSEGEKAIKRRKIIPSEREEDNTDYDVPFLFNSQWAIVDKKEGELEAMYHTGLDYIEDNPWSEFKEWLQNSLDDDRQSHTDCPIAVKKITIKWGHLKMRKSDVPMSTIKSIADGSMWRLAEKQLARLNHEGKKDLFIDLFVKVERPPKKKQAKQPEARTPAANQRRRRLLDLQNSQPRGHSSQPRASVTNWPTSGQGPRSSNRTAHDEAMDDLLQLEDRLDESGDWRLQIIGRWRCTNGACPNSRSGNGVCWHWGIDTPKHHCAVAGELMTTWAAGVRTGELAIDDPGSQLAAQMVYDMMKNPKTAGGSIAANRQGRHGGGGAPVHVKVLNFLGQQGPSSKAAAATTGDTPPRSSQVSVPDTKEQRERFFSWLSNKLEWKGKEMDIQAMRVAFEAEDLSLWQIGRVSIADWKLYNLKAGHHERVQQAVQRYKERF